MRAKYSSWSNYYITCELNGFLILIFFLLLLLIIINRAFVIKNLFFLGTIVAVAKAAHIGAFKAICKARTGR